MNDVLISSSMLFAGITQAEAGLMLPCLGATRRAFSREERIMRAGQPTEYLGVVLSGRVRIEVSDAWSETTILDMLGPGSLFAHGYACSMEPLDIDVLADSACEVVLLKAERIIHPCPKQCGCHAHISSNLMRALALSNLDMNRRAIAMTPKTIRGKILAFLSQQQKKAGTRAFAIPYSQTKLASYLSVDRSALSNELSKLRREKASSTTKAARTGSCSAHGRFSVTLLPMSRANGETASDKVIASLTDNATSPKRQAYDEAPATRGVALSSAHPLDMEGD